MCGFLAAGSSEFAPKAFADALAKLNDRGPDMTRTISMDDKVFGLIAWPSWTCLSGGCSLS